MAAAEVGKVREAQLREKGVVKIARIIIYTINVVSKLSINAPFMSERLSRYIKDPWIQRLSGAQRIPKRGRGFIVLKFFQ